MSKKTRTKRPNNTGDALTVRVYHPSEGQTIAARDGRLYANVGGRTVKVEEVVIPRKRGR